MPARRILIRRSRFRSRSSTPSSRSNYRVSLTNVLTGLGQALVPVNEDWNGRMKVQRRAGRRSARSSRGSNSSRCSVELYIASEDELDEDHDAETSEESVEVLTSGSEADVSSEQSDGADQESESEPERKKQKGDEAGKTNSDKPDKEVVCLKKMKQNGTTSNGQVCLKKQRAETQDAKAGNIDTDQTKSGNKQTKLKEKKKAKAVESSADESDADGEGVSDTPAEASNVSLHNDKQKGKHKRKQKEANQDKPNQEKDPKGENEKIQEDKETVQADDQPAGKLTEEDKVNAGGWTLSEDANIQAMKAGGESWSVIGQKVGRSKKDVQKRWKELQVKDHRPKEDQETRLDKPKDSADKEPPTQATETAAGMVGGPVQQQQAWYASPQYWPYNPEYQQRQHEIYRQTLGHMYPPAVTLRPDRQWSQTDCELLAMLDSRHSINRWLELQAGFYNATGRMVPVELLKAKLGEAEGGK